MLVEVSPCASAGVGRTSPKISQESYPRAGSRTFCFKGVVTPSGFSESPKTAPALLSAIAPARMSERSSRLLPKAKLLDWNLRYFGASVLWFKRDVIDSEIQVLNPSTLQELDEAKRALEEEAAAATKVPSKHIMLSYVVNDFL